MAHSTCMLAFALVLICVCEAYEENQATNSHRKTDRMVPGIDAASSNSSHLRTQMPEQIHIALAGNNQGISDAMAVSWATPAATNNSIVKYGTNSGHYDHVAIGTQRTYNTEWYYHHEAVMVNLMPNTTYFYVVGDENSGLSDEFSFVTAPPNEMDRPLTLMIYGDMGVFNSNNTRGAIKRRYDEIEFIWHTGDISYADDAPNHYSTFYYEKIWNEFMNWMQNVTAYKPYMVLPGNHEVFHTAECHSDPCKQNPSYGLSLQNFTAYNYRFRQPWRESGAVSNMWYSFNYGSVHFVSIDTETDYPGAPEETSTSGHFGNQLQWLENDLRQANESRHLRPWIIVSGHRPIYSIENSDQYGNITGQPIYLAKAVEDLFYKYYVDVYFCGHQHHYERQWPVYQTIPEKSYVNPRATTYILNGAAGNDEGHTLDPSTIPDWNAASDDKHYGYGMLTVYNSSTIQWGFYKSVDDSLVDSITLFREH